MCIRDRLRDLAWKRGLQSNHEGRYSVAIALYKDALATHLAADAENADTTRKNQTASLLTVRGNVKQSTEGHGPGAAIDDYDVAIEIKESLRSVLEPSGQWVPQLRNNLARAYINRGNSKQSAEGHGPGAAIDDYDVAIEIMESLRSVLEPSRQWVPEFRNDLALALINRARAGNSLVKSGDENARSQACSHTRRAITIWEALVKNEPALTNTITPYLELAQNLLTELGCESA